MLHISKTEKLFFGKFTHKLAVTTPLATYFRSKNFKGAQEVISELSHKFEVLKVTRIQHNRYHRETVSVKDIFMAQRLLDTLSSAEEEYALRIECNDIGIYTSSTEFVDRIFKIKDIKVAELVRPEDDIAAKILTEGHNLIIRSSYEYKYKIALKPLYKDGESFMSWATTMKNVKVQSSRSYKYGGTFYVKDDKTLTMCRLFLGDKIQKVSEFVTRNEK